MSAEAGALPGPGLAELLSWARGRRPCLPLFLQGLKQSLLAVPFQQLLLLIVEILDFFGGSDQVEAGDGDHPRVHVGAVEGDLQGRLPD